MLSTSSGSSAHRFPIIPLQPLLTEAQYGELLAAVSKYQAFAHSHSRHDEDTNTTNKQATSGEDEFLLMFKATAPFSSVALKESWRLWRYVGGRDALEMIEAGVGLKTQAEDLRLVNDATLRIEGCDEVGE